MILRGACMTGGGAHMSELTRPDVCITLDFPGADRPPDTRGDTTRMQKNDTTYSRINFQFGFYYKRKKEKKLPLR